jgi:hypothetical protein
MSPSGHQGGTARTPFSACPRGSLYATDLGPLRATSDAAVVDEDVAEASGARSHALSGVAAASSLLECKFESGTAGLMNRTGMGGHRGGVTR